MKAANLLLSGLLALFGSGFAAAQSIGDPSSGLTLSRQLCADCHAIEPGSDHSPKSKALTFEVIANTPGMTAIALSAWLHSSHSTMPLVQLDGRTREDIAAYILSLKSDRQQAR